MEQAAVAQAIETLQAQGKEPSIGNIRRQIGHGSLRDLTRHRRALLPHLGRRRMETQTAVADTPAAVLEPLPAPVPLLVQAKAALQAALVTERQAQRAYHLATDQQERARCQQQWMRAKRDREQAQNLVDARQRAKARLIAEIPAARIDARRLGGALAVLEDETHRRLLRARREAAQAQAELDAMVEHLTQLAGNGAVPVEAGS
jgi:hypothetical protein